MAWTDEPPAAYDAVGVSVLLSPAASPRGAHEPEFYYTLAFPATAACGRSHCEPQHRVSYRDAVLLLRAVTAGGRERERRAVDEFRAAWQCKFRCPATPSPFDTVPRVLLLELLREVIVQRFDAMPELAIAARASADGRLLVLRVRPSAALLATTAEALQLKVPVARELDPGDAYWRADPHRGAREATRLDRPEAQEQLYRLFLAGKIAPADAQLFEHEDEAMWSRRVHALQRFADPHAVAAAAAQTHAPRSLPYSARAALQYVFRMVESSVDSSPFRVVDKIRLTKAIVDAEFDCDALVAHGVLAHHLCTHTRRADAVDTSIDALRAQWGSLLAPWRVARMRLAPLSALLHFQPIAHVRDYFGEEIALYFAYTSFYAQALQLLAGAALLFSLLQSWLRADDSRVAYAVLPFALINCAAARVFVRKWSLRQRALASAWGVADECSHTHATTRPQFRGELARSAVHLRLEPHYPPARRAAKRVVSYALLLLLAASLLSAYHALLATRALESAALGAAAAATGLQGTHVLLAAATKCVAAPLAHVCRRLNDWENYKTQSDYDANLTLKFALLLTANNFGLLWFMSFVRPFVSVDACNEAVLGRSCREQAATLLRALLTLDLALTLWELRAPVVELLLVDARRWLRRQRRKRRVKYELRHRSDQTVAPDDSSEVAARQALLQRSGGSATTARHDSSGDDDEQQIAASRDTLEAELALTPYEGVLFDYAQVVGGFGYVAWFAALAPVPACVLAWTVAVLQIRVDAFKLSHVTQRPFPAPRSSIGSWLLYLRVLSLGALLHNAALAYLLWAEQLAPQRVVHVRDLVVDADTARRLARETEALVVFAVFALVWVVAGLPDQHDRAAARELQRASERDRFLARKYLRNVDCVTDAVRAALPPGRVFLNGVHRYVVTGDRHDEDAADEVLDELRARQLRALDVDRRVAELRAARADVGVLVVEVERINLLPVMDALTNAVDSFVQLQLESPAPVATPPPAAAAAAAVVVKGSSTKRSAAAPRPPPVNTAVVKKNRSPQWHETFEFPVTSLDDALALGVFDWELLGRNRRIGCATLLVADVVARTGAAASESPVNRQRHGSSDASSDRDRSLELTLGSFELPIELPDALRSSLTRAELARHGPPRLELRCGVQLRELGVLLAQRRRLAAQIEALQARATRFSQWT